MNRDRHPRLRRPRPLLLAALLALAVPTLPAAEPSGGFDAAATWQHFLATAGTDGSGSPYDSLDLLEIIGYDEHAVDAVACEAHREQVAKAVEMAPVSIALRHAALLCAQAITDTAAAARESAALDALSALALSQADVADPSLALPIRVMGKQDMRTLLVLAGLESRYEYYISPRPIRFLPYVVAVGDPETGGERHLMFDMVDTMNAAVRSDPYSGYPMQRLQLSDALVDAEAANGQLAAIDAKAVREASMANGVDARIEAVRIAAGEGGIQSLATWLLLCQQAPANPSCSSGLVDALLAGAEQRHALPMAMLSYAYATGTGVGKDEAAAATLLDDADERWAPASASGFVASLALATTPKTDIPAFFRARADRAIAAGDRATMLLDASQRMARALPLDERQLIAFATPAYNARGAGHELLARDALLRKDVPSALDWTRRAAQAGNPWGEDQYAWQLRFGRDVAKDRVAAQAWLKAAAHDAKPMAARILAGDADAVQDWDQAMAWLFEPASRGDMESLLALAGLMVSGVAGDDKVATGLEVYRSLADEADLPEARRRLASLALRGDGMEKSPAKAEAWLRKDAERGDHVSEAMLGGALLRGDLGKVDEVEGQRWMERAIAAKEAAAYVEYGAWLFYTKDTPDSRRRAMEIWSQGVELGQSMAANNLAWALCTSPDDAIRDPKHGLEVGAKIGDVDEIDPGFLDTVAACHAATGDYETAVRMQNNVVERFDGQAKARPGDTAMAETAKRAAGRLALYQAGKPYLEASRD
ncbi:tetratricopeptide repeat protein [Luteimonas sp. 22616]|uniref:tetratricopeptide repeat protein n=1 Tax=Luteimonas sp. 22616 TaxID=3453951 RepID=UPI003F8599C3